MFANFATAITTSTAITLTLFYVMNLLIVVQPGVTVEPRQRAVIDWIHVEPPVEPPQTHVERVPPREVDYPSMPPLDSDYSGNDGLRIPVPPPPNPKGRTGVRPGLVPNGPLVSLFPVRPSYPTAAKQRGLSGYAVVRFDVMTDGTVSNIEIVESSNGLFEPPSLRAAKRLRFKPMVIDGIPQVSNGVRYRFTFRMDSKD